MNLSHPVSTDINTNRLTWLLAAVIISLSLLVVNIHYRISMASIASYSVRNSVNPAIRQDASLHELPVPTPAHSQLLPAQVPIMRATLVPAEAKQFPRVQPVATPPAGN